MWRKISSEISQQKGKRLYLLQLLNLLIRLIYLILSVRFISSLQIIDILPEELCPPEGTGESQELLLKLLCGVLSISIVVVLTKLGYDYTIYRRRGQLPWLALKMP